MRITLALLLLVTLTLGCGCASGIPYQAGYTREAYTAGVTALATAREANQINDDRALDFEAARLVVVTAIDLQDPLHIVMPEPIGNASGVPATPTARAASSDALNYVRAAIAAMRAGATITNSVTAQAEAAGEPLGDEHWKRIMNSQAEAERRWAMLLPRQ